MTDAAGFARRLLTRVLGVEEDELPPVAAGMLMFFLLFAGYFMLRPVRETMGIAGGVRNLQWLFTGTFIATLVAIPLFGTIASRVARRRILPWTYGFFATNLLGFAVAISAAPDNAWLARGFYIWLSVFNLLAISVAWSVLADLMPSSQAKRLFALVAAGASAGGLAGPAMGLVLVGPLGHGGLMAVATALLVGSAAAAMWLQRWRDAHPLDAADAPARRAPLGGNPFAGIGTVLRSPYLLGIATFVVLLATVTTFLYFEQARLVEMHFPDPIDQTRVFGLLDALVQTLAILTQLFLTGRIVRRLGLVVLLTTVPVVMVGGFLWLAMAPTFAVLAIVMVTRRAGEYALARPGREMLFTVVAPDQKYKAKNVIDTAVYRGADAVSGWVKAGIDAIASSPAVVGVLGAMVALAWAGTGFGLARAQGRREAAATAPAGRPG
ncbi:MAG: ADP/ATP translocating protein [Arenimonas sp. SCN 70-307]|uniref:NTP/NDP exchange transporter n=1 Tax=Arenimonas sp. SCN 70-307 TaxID=1660089 RepID=UPI00086DEB2E|nr:MFS transporter [Arenimonas sp. SCN 70-307]ODS62847.1 MAG: ADP/ATP translocating protein [Arenimonas sp. SCN 70-307]